MLDVRPLLTALIRTLDVLEIPYVIGGSFASGAWGNPRQTNDLDISLYLRESDVDELVRNLKDDFMVDREEILRCLQETDECRSFQLLHETLMFKVDAFVPPPSPYRESEVQRRVLLELVPGVKAYCAAAENIVIQKLRWFELGNRVSDRQWNDIVQVLEVQHGALDEEYMRHWARHFGLEELLDEAMAQVEA